jgi:putative flippase GtrA
MKTFFSAIFAKYKTGIIHFLKFNFVGLINTGLTIAVYNILLVLKVDSAIAYPAGYASGLINSFILNKLWTFAKKQSFSIREVIKFTIVNLVAFGGGQLFILLNKNYAFMHPTFAQLVTLVFSIPVNYIGAKYWAFKDEIKSEKNN